MSGSTASRRSLRARGSLTSSGASPELSRKRSRNVEDAEESEPACKRMTSSEEGQQSILRALAEINKRFDDVPNRGDLSQLEVNIRSRIEENSKEIAKVRAIQNKDRANPVSYTHLTLPTIYSV